MNLKYNFKYVIKKKKNYGFTLVGSDFCLVKKR